MQAVQAVRARERFKLQRRTVWLRLLAGEREPVSRSMLLSINHLVQTWVSTVGLTREPGFNKTLTG